LDLTDKEGVYFIVLRAKGKEVRRKRGNLGVLDRLIDEEGGGKRRRSSSPIKGKKGPGFLDQKGEQIKKKKDSSSRGSLLLRGKREDLIPRFPRQEEERSSSLSNGDSVRAERDFVCEKEKKERGGTAASCAVSGERGRISLTLK